MLCYFNNIPQRVLVKDLFLQDQHKIVIRLRTHLVSISWYRDVFCEYE